MLKIGLTGGIGSGKTVASDAFKELGVPVIDTDIIARDVLNDNTLLEALTDAFGTEILDEQHQLIREKLRHLAFQNSQKKALLDSIMHPAIRQTTLHRIRIAEEQKHPYCIIVVPLLIETGFIELVDHVLVVTAPHSRKLTWLAQRSQLSTDSAEKIMSTQTSDEEKLNHADDHIHNDRDIPAVQQQVALLHQKYLQLAEN